MRPNNATFIRQSPSVLAAFLMIAATLNAARRFFTGMFFYPTAEKFGAPSERGLIYENVRFRSGTEELHGYLLRARGPSRGVILHCHGNAGNVTSHFPLIAFLTEAGYDVMTFDYAGFGESTGRPTLAGIEENARDARDYLLGRTDLPTARFAVFGQSLGGAAAAAAAADPAVKCLILEATFTTYREIAWTTAIGRLLFFLVPVVIPDGGPARQLGSFSPRPVLLVHGEADSVVPVKFSHRLHELFPRETTILTIPNVGHLTPGVDQSSPFDAPILEFLELQLGRP